MLTSGSTFPLYQTHILYISHSSEHSTHPPTLCNCSHSTKTTIQKKIKTQCVGARSNSVANSVQCIIVYLHARTPQKYERLLY